jgi:bifunctional non-homologous end joining protein LigD
VPAGTGWIDEIEHDGYRLMLIREHDRVRLISRGGHDWAKQFPRIGESALKRRQKHFVIDGEAVVLNKDGISDFDALASRRHGKRATLSTCSGEGLRALPQRPLQLGRRMGSSMLELEVNQGT